MTKVYCRCNSGHYFIGATCPLDGWSSEESDELTRTVEAVMNAGKELSIENLCEAGLSVLARKRTIVIEFGNDESTFDAVSPAGYFVNGQWIKQRNFDEDFLETGCGLAFGSSHTSYCAKNQILRIPNLTGAPRRTSLHSRHGNVT